MVKSAVVKYCRQSSTGTDKTFYWLKWTGRKLPIIDYQKTFSIIVWHDLRKHFVGFVEFLSIAKLLVGALSILINQLHCYRPINDGHINLVLACFNVIFRKSTLDSDLEIFVIHGYQKKKNFLLERKLIRWRFPNIRKVWKHVMMCSFVQGKTAFHISLVLEPPTFTYRGQKLSILDFSGKM